MNARDKRETGTLRKYENIHTFDAEEFRRVHLCPVSLQADVSVAEKGTCAHSLDPHKGAGGAAVPIHSRYYKAQEESDEYEDRERCEEDVSAQSQLQFRKELEHYY